MQILNWKGSTDPLQLTFYHNFIIQHKQWGGLITVVLKGSSQGKRDF